MHQTIYCNMCSHGKIYQLQVINVIHQLHLFNRTNAWLVIDINVTNHDVTITVAVMTLKHGGETER